MNPFFFFYLFFDLPFDIQNSRSRNWIELLLSSLVERKWLTKSVDFWAATQTGVKQIGFLPMSVSKFIFTRGNRMLSSFILSKNRDNFQIVDEHISES